MEFPARGTILRKNFRLWNGLNAHAQIMSDAVWTHGRNDVTQSDHLQDLARRYQPPVVLLYRDSECAGIPPGAAGVVRSFARIFGLSARTALRSAIQPSILRGGW